MPDHLPNPEKTRLRRQLRQARAGVPGNIRRQASKTVQRWALELGLIAYKRRIGFYVPAKAELDCTPLLNRARAVGAECYLPVVPHHSQKKLWFCPLGDGPHWKINRFGIPEYGLRHTRVRVSVLDVVFMPLLGFDLRGYRMGMGGGYYDASLAFLGRRRRWRRPKLIGLAFEAQKIERLPQDPWDIPLQAVLSEKRYYRFPAQ